VAGVLVERVLYALMKQLHRRHRKPPLGAVARRFGLPAFLAVLGPGLLAGLSDDDPAGITTYSILGARYGYECRFSELAWWPPLERATWAPNGAAVRVFSRVTRGRRAEAAIEPARQCLERCSS
jgi:hypothetical protein